MSLRLMKERMAISGVSQRNEMIADGQRLLNEELEYDSSYSPTMFVYDATKNADDKQANLRVFGRKYSSLNGNYMNFMTTCDNALKIGDYIHDIKDDTYWLVCTSFNVNDVHYEGKLIQCNYLLKWQLSNGKIIERWANIVSASKYDMGETGNSTIVLSSNNFSILIGFCEEGYELEGKRVFIDKRTVNPEKVFKITRGDDVLYNSGNMGSLLSFIADKTEINKSTDRPDLKLCDYVEENVNGNETTVLRSTIAGNKNLKIGLSRTYAATIMDADNNELAWDNTYSWNIVSDFDVKQTVYCNKIELLVEDEEFIGSSFILRVIKDGTVITEIEITIANIF